MILPGLVKRRTVLAGIAGIAGVGALAGGQGLPGWAAGSQFVSRDGTNLKVNGNKFVIHGATTYGQLDRPEALVALARGAQLNTLELVEFETSYRQTDSLMSEATWVRCDRLIAAARNAGLRIVLNFSSYGHTLAASGRKPTTTDWNPYLTFAMTRVNTVTGVQYRNDPTIAKVQLYGEISAPNYSDPMRGTTQETTQFFNRSLRQLRALDANHLISTGGFSHLNDPGSGIDWQTIMSDPVNQVCDIEINSVPDRNISVPMVAALAVKTQKPWYLAAFSSCQGQPHHKDDANHYAKDVEMAAHVEDCYRLARVQGAALPAPTKQAAGATFWNLAATPAAPESCDIGPQYPLTFAKVKAWAP